MSNLVGATTAVFPVHLSIASNEIINVGWRTIDGTAKGGIDYQALDGVVRFLPGEIEGKIEVLVYGGMEPSAADSSKIFYIRLDPPSGAILESSLLACKIIVDVLGEYSVVSVIVAEGRRGLKGETGRSAYEQAVYMGLFTGTVEQWMQQIADASSAADRAENAAVVANSKVLAEELRAEAAERSLQSSIELKAPQLTTFTKTEVTGLVNPKADKTYVDVALSGFTNGASKFYATLALANADIANIGIKDKVDIGEVANGGTWYKAAAGATTLTKSAYDPLTQANNYTNNAVATANDYTDLVFDAVPVVIASYVAQAEAAATAATIGADVFDTPEAGVDPVTGVDEGAYFNVRSPSSDSYIDEYQNIGGVATPSGKSYPSGAYVQSLYNETEVIKNYLPMPFVIGKEYKIHQPVKLDNGNVVRSTIANNTNNPNNNMTGWIDPLAALAKKTVLLVDDYFVEGMANWGVALQAAIDAANNAGGGRVFMPARVYDTSKTIVMKSNVILEGEFRGARATLEGTVIRKNGNYVGLRFGTLTTVRCDDFGVYNLSVDGNGFSGDGFSFEHCHYFEIGNLTSARNTNGGRGFHFYYTWSGKIGQLFSMFNDINYRFFFQCNALDIGHLYSSTADGGATKVHLQIGGLLGVNIKLLTTEGVGRYHIQQLGYTQNLKIGSWYSEFDQATAGLLGVLYSNASDDAQKNIATSIDNIMIIGNGISTAFSLINISNSHRGYVFKNAYIRLGGTTDYSATPVMRVNNNNLNTDAKNVEFDQIHIEDNTTGNATTTWGVSFQGAKSSDGKATNITTTKASLVSKWGNFDYDQKTNGRSFAYLTPISLVVPRYVGERFTATTKNRLYVANGLAAGDWARMSGAVELVDEPLFTAIGAWTLGAGWSVSGGDLVVSGTGVTSQQLDIKADNYYRVRFAVKDFASGSVNVNLGGVLLATVTANTTFDQIIRATNFNQLSLNASVASNLKFDYFSVTESGAI